MPEYTKPIIDEVGHLYCVKENSVGPPNCYLGADTMVVQMKSGIECWAMSSDSYVREAIANVEILLGQDGRKWSKPKTTFPKMTYKPELDASPLLDLPMIS